MIVTPADTLFDRAIVACIPAIIKAMPEEANGRRVVEVQASCEAVDYDGDVVLQEALLNSATSFVATGHLDIDHLSEFGQRLGIPDPSSYIVGRPLSVRAGPDRTTFVQGEISRARSGLVDPTQNRFDEFWMSLQRDPPVVWYSSIYGWPIDFDDCAAGTCSVSGASRYVIKSMDWRSLAFTRSPKNTALTSPTRIVTAKSYIAELAKGLPPSVTPLESMADVWDNRVCKACDVHAMPSLLGYRQHFAKCAGFSIGLADLYAHALMHKTNMERAMPFAGAPAGM